MAKETAEHQANKIKFEEKKIKDQADEIKKQQDRIKELMNGTHKA
jgi:uncharacterized phage infection (PIP) family protein YhgE|tara:strand:+ start:1322 stop:1456 length:135 start_codon:yes stop_codon:yes gene_type:complete